MVGTGLGRVVRGAGPVGVLLGEGVVGVEGEVAVDLARRDVVEPRDLGLARGLEHGLGPEHVGAEETARVEDGQAVVGLGGEVDDRVDVGAARRVAQGEIAVAHVAVDEDDPVLEVDEVGRLPA